MEERGEEKTIEAAGENDRNGEGKRTECGAESAPARRNTNITFTQTDAFPTY